MAGRADPMLGKSERKSFKREPLPSGRYFAFIKIIYRLPFRFASLLSQAPASLRVAFGELFAGKLPPLESRAGVFQSNHTS
jgi:hypothetical protein